MDDWKGEKDCQYYNGILRTTHKICCGGVVTWTHKINCGKIRQCYDSNCRRELCELFKEKVK